MNPAVLFFGALTLAGVAFFLGWYLRGLRVPKVVEKVVEVPVGAQPRDKAGKYVKKERVQ